MDGQQRVLWQQQELTICDCGYCSVDTVKTRLQGQPPYRAPKYFNMIQSYRTILKEEGIVRGLYAGVTPAMLGSGKANTKGPSYFSTNGTRLLFS